MKLFRPHITDIESNFLPDASGSLNIGSVPLAFDEAHINKVYLEGNPTTGFEATTKDYVDAQIASGGGTLQTVTDAGNATTNNVLVNADTDTVGGVTASRAKIGMPTGGSSDYAYFGHVDSFGDGGSFAMAQGSAGTTLISCAGGQFVRLQADANTFKVDSSGFTFNAGIDSFTLTGDGTDWYQKWSDGGLYLMSDEGTNPVTNVYIVGKGSGDAVLHLEDGSSANQSVHFKMGGTTASTYYGSATTEFAFNENGVDVDFRVESDANTHILFVDAGNDRVAIGLNAPETLFHIYDGAGGSAALPGNGDILTVENDSQVYINLITPADTNSGILFSDDSRAAGYILYNNGSAGLMQLGSETGIQFIQNSDTLSFTGDGSDWYVKWSDGSLKLQTDEGVNTATTLDVIGKGTSGGRINVKTGDDSNDAYQFMVGGDGVAHLHGGTGITRLNFNANLFDCDFQVGAVGQANALFVQGSDGNVGIGTSSPDSILTVYKDNTSEVFVQCQYGGNRTGRVHFSHDNNSWNSYGAGVKGVYDGADARLHSLELYTSSATRESITAMTIDEDGNVGIGTGSPTSTLDVAGDIEVGSSNYIYMGDPTTDGSWRFGLSGTDMEIQRREASSWVTKSTVTA